MSMDSNNNNNNSAENVASKLAEVSLSSPDSNNNSGKGIESGDAGKLTAKPTDLETVPESEVITSHNDSHDKVSDSGKENTEKVQENVEAAAEKPVVNEDEE